MMITAPTPATPSTAPLTPRRRPSSVHMLIFIGCTVLILLFAFPIVWSFLNSLKTPAEAMASPPTWWPSAFTFDSYRKLFEYSPDVGQSIINSVLVSLGTIIGTVLLSLLAGYGFARFAFPGRNIIFISILAALMIPFQSILTPLFLILKTFNLNNTLTGLVLIYITFQLPFAVFLMRNSFQAVPIEIEEAAVVDGAGPAVLLTRIMLPLVMPGAITVGLFAFFGSWNEFIAALIFQSDTSKYTLPVMLLNATTGMYGSVNWGTVQAGMVISMLPCALIFLALQRYYLGGLTAGSVK